MRYFLSLVLILMFFSCERALPTDDSVVKTPSHLLSVEQFTDMYYDAQLTEGAVRLEVGKGAKSKEISAYLYQQLFDKYGISEEDFEANIKYYASDPELMQEIQTEVVNRLTLEESRLTNQ